MCFTKIELKVLWIGMVAGALLRLHATLHRLLSEIFLNRTNIVFWKTFYKFKLFFI